MRDFARRELRSELFEAALETCRFGRESLACLCFGHRGRQRFRQATFGNTELVAVFGDFIVQRAPALLATFDIGFELFDTRAKATRALGLILVEPLGAGRGFGVAVDGIAESRDLLEQLIAIGFGDGDGLPRFLQISLGLCQIDLARIFASDEVGNPLIRLLKVCLQRGVRAVLVRRSVGASRSGVRLCLRLGCAAR